jgi:hypothetical protein
MCFLRDHECDQWQPHANEDNFPIVDFAGSGRDHQFA